jgi:hypothetical protein
LEDYGDLNSLRWDPFLPDFGDLISYADLVFLPNDDCFDTLENIEKLCWWFFSIVECLVDDLFNFISYFLFDLLFNLFGNF